MVMNFNTQQHNFGAMETETIKNGASPKSHTSRGNFFNFSIVCFLATSMSFIAGCNKDDPNNPSNSVPDPEGTITANISYEPMNVIRVDFLEKGAFQIGWKVPSNFILYCGSNFSQKVSICDLGIMSGLGNIVQIPSSGFSIPAQESSSVACEVGHGYILKYESSLSLEPLYVRLYVVELIVNIYDEIFGVKVKYQYPFEP